MPGVRQFLKATVPLCAAILLSCDGPSIRPLELVAEGKDPEALDWQIPTGLSPLRVLEKLDGSRLHALDPLQRATLQRDLWMIFNGPRYELQDSPVRERLSVLLRDLALTEEQLRSLPDTYAEATRRFPSQYDPARPDAPFLPATLFDPDGPWILLTTNYPVAYRHDSFFGYRSAFLLFLRLPAGRQATTDYVEKLRANKWSDMGVEGMEFVLLRRALLINDHGVPVPSSLTESVQVRHFFGPASEDQAFHKFELRRQDGRLHPFGPGEGKPSYALSFEHSMAHLGLRTPVVDTCKNCHFAPEPFPMGRPDAWFGTLRPGTIEGEQKAIVKAKERDETWKALMELWKR